MRKFFLLVVVLSFSLFIAGLSFAAAPPFLPFNSTGDLYVLEHGSGDIIRITPGGGISVAVSAAQIMAATGGASVSFTDNGIAIDANGNIFFTDGTTESILRKNAGGPVTMITSAAAISAAGGTAEINLLVQRIAFGSDGMLYVSEEGGGDLLQVNPATGAVTEYVDGAAFAACCGLGSWNFSGDIVATEGGLLYVSSDGGDDIVTVTLGTPPTLALLSNSASFSDLDVFSTRASNGDLIISDDAGGDTIWRVTPAGAVSTFLSEAALEGAGCVNADVDLEGGIAFDSAGNFYLAEENSDNIYRFDAGLNCSLWISSAQMQAVTGVIPDLDGGIAFAVRSLPAPTMTDWGMIVFMVLAGLGSVVYLRKQHRV